MSQVLTTALAPTFSWTTSSTDLVLTFASGASPINVAIPTGTYRMLLGPSTGDGADFLQAVAAAIATSISGAVRSETFTVSMRPSGRVRITSSGTVTISGTGPAAKALGLETATGTTFDAARAPKWFAAFVERQSSAFIPRTASRFATTIAGESYGWRSGVVVSRMESMRLGFIPSDPTYQAALNCAQTPAMPADEYASSIGSHDGVWSVADVLMASGGKVVALASGNLQTLLTSTTERYHLGALSPADVSAPRFELDDPAWPAYQRLTLSFTRSATAPTGVRA